MEEQATYGPLEDLTTAIEAACRTDQAALTRERCTLALQGKLQPTKVQQSIDGLFAQTQTTLW